MNSINLSNKIQPSSSNFFTGTHRQFRIWKRPRLKFNQTKSPSPPPSLTVRNQFGVGGGGGGGPIFSSTQFENIFHSLITQFPSISSLDLIVPALGFASGFALYFSSKKKKRLDDRNGSDSGNVVSDVGEWILFTSPTPFNRFVILRCPSISILRGSSSGDSELLDDVNERLVKEDRHFVKLNSGRIQIKGGFDFGNDNDNDDDDDDVDVGGKLVYQRICVSLDDGGVVSLDWPDNLDLNEEPGMDTTVLIVPGTTEGSMDKNVKGFVVETLKRGCFPVVMNPRGCAGSPLTTPRLFSAADSDDISTAIQFINRARPWTTLMGVGWGYGANMLTKYLAEVGEKTPLTAATCIDNPFELEEATRSSLHHTALNQKLSKGLKDILQSNKELFQGRTKGFNVEKALSATSLRDFDQAISMVSYGYDAVEEFYSKASTRELIDNVKIPVLFIQTDNGTVPPYSIPRSSIAENPFTSLLLCSCLPSSVIISERFALSWCQDLAVEWLTAVELGLLKGRHPLLKDVDVTINPSKGLSLVEGRPSDENKDDARKINNFTQSRALRNYDLDPIGYTLEESGRAADVRVRSQSDFLESPQPQQEGNDMSEQSSSADAESVKEEEDNPPVDNEESQVVLTANMVMKMLDVTMPGTLAEDQKKQVLKAIGRGDTLLTALEGAVPEDVRGKLTAAVSEIVQRKGTKLNLDGIMKVGRSITESSESKVKIQETGKEPSPAAGGSDNVHPPPDLVKKGDDEISDNGSGKNQNMELKQDNGEGEASKDMATRSSSSDENGSGTGSKPEKPSDEAADTDNGASAQVKVNQDNAVDQVTKKEGNDQQNIDGKSGDDSTDQNMPSPTTKTEEPLPPETPAPEPPPMEKEGNDIQKSEDKNMPSLADQDKQTSTKTEESSPAPPPASNPPPAISVSQAFGALTGFDDSTQMAVNTVFGVLENMITQFEDNAENEDNEHEKGGDQDKRHDGEPGSSSEEFSISGGTEKNSTGKGVDNNRPSLDSNFQQSHNHTDNKCDEIAYSNKDAENGSSEVQLNQSSTSWVENGSSHENNMSGRVVKDKNDWRRKDLFDPKNMAKGSDKVVQMHKIPSYVTANPYGDSLYNEYLRNYLLSQSSGPESLDLDSTTDLFLDYFPEEGQWKFLDRDSRDSVNNIRTRKGFSAKGQPIHSPLHGDDTDQIIETSYVILDTEDEQKPLEDHKTVDDLVRKLEGRSPRLGELLHLIKKIILGSLKVEVGRRLGVGDVQEMESGLAFDLERVAEAVSLGLGQNKDLLENRDPAPGKVGTLHGDYVVQTISSALEDASYLKKVLPVGVIVGSSLAALRKYFNVATHNDNVHGKQNVIDQDSSSREKFLGQVSEKENDHQLVQKKDDPSEMDKFISRASENLGALNLSKDTVMVGAVTAALGASAFLVPDQKQEQYRNNETTENSYGSFNGKANQLKEQDRMDDAISDKKDSNIVSSLAEKAMSVAGPVVPTTSNGEVDQDRLVTMLADLGQRGGILKLVGKLALLWGGLRGAMSLTDRLISFLHISERPLPQRILGFVGMVLVLWSPVVIPMFPTLVQSWTTHQSTGMAVNACIIGLYTAVIILITIWGKRVRGFENPVQQYGMDLTSLPKIGDFAKGLLGGVMLVLSIHFTNALLGCANLCWPSSLSISTPGAMVWLKVYGGLFIIAGQGIITATVVAIVEELLFRSWLVEEIAVDFGYHRAVIMSGLAFALLQRSMRAIPGLWLLSLALSGARQRNNGSLAVPIGMRAGVLATCFFLQTSGFLIYHRDYPLWLTGTHPLQPLSGAVGISLSLLLAVYLYRQQPPGAKTITRVTEQ